MRTIKTVPEMSKDMLSDLSESEKKRRIYKTESEEFKKQELAVDIGRAITLFDTDRVKVNLNDAEEVRQRIIDYFKACQATGIFPSVQGLATHGFGISRQALNQWRRRRDNYKLDSAKLIDIACDSMADILTNQSLHNNCNPVQSLFQLKNNHAFSDRVELEAVQARDEEEYLSEEDLRRKYAYLLDTIPEPDE